MVRRQAISAIAAFGAVVGAYTAARWWVSRMREEAAAHAILPETLPATCQHTVRGPNDTLIAAYDTSAPRDGVPQIVFVHGWMGSHHIWDWVIRPLYGDARMVTFDLPFHGQSGAPQPEGIDLDFFGDALHSVINELVPSGPIVLVGHSLGGMVILNALRRHGAVLASRLSATVLISTAASFSDTPTALVNYVRPVFASAKNVFRSGIAGVAGRLVSSAVRRDTDMVWLFARSIQGRHAQPAITYGIVQTMRAAHPKALAAVAPAVLTLHERDGLTVAASRPLCLIGGSDDWLTPASVTHALAAQSGAEVVMFDEVGHVAPKEVADQVAAVIGRYVGIRSQPQASP
ncbi:MAG: alpha/beta hydrolase [Nitriliruptoraceae bacterium]